MTEQIDWMFRPVVYRLYGADGGTYLLRINAQLGSTPEGTPLPSTLVAAGNSCAVDAAPEHVSRRQG